MTPLIAVLDWTDYAVITGIVIVFAGGAAYTTRQDINLARLERQVRHLQQTLEALLKHQGVTLPAPPPSGLSPEVEALARDASRKIAAIKLYRQENPGMSLVEAKRRIEDFIQSDR
jgi:ribosomal protein L7/L12